MTAELLPIRSLRVLGGDGAVRRIASVYCPLREKSLSLGQCLECERSSGLRFDAQRRRSRILCDAATAADSSPEGAVACRRTAEKQDAATTPVSAVMSTDVLAVTADVSVESLTNLLLDRPMGGAPVVDDEGRALGVVSKTDLLERERDRGETEELDTVRAGHGLHQHYLARATVGEIMSPLVLAVPEGTSIAQVAALMAFEGVHRVPVVSESRQVVGLVTSIDILRWMGRRSGYLLPETTPRALALDAG